MIYETLASPNIEVGEIYSLEVLRVYLDVAYIALPTGRQTPIRQWGSKERLKAVAKYTLISKKIYKKGRVIPFLWCLGKHETTWVLAKVHKGSCNSHIGGKPLAHKLLRVG